MFEALRSPGWNVYYEGRGNTAASYDVDTVILTCVTVVLVLCVVLSLVGQRRRKRKWTTAAKLLICLQIGISILVCLHCSSWQTSSVSTVCEYINQPSVHDINADISVNIGLKSMNVTLSGKMTKHKFYYNEKVNFNEYNDLGHAYKLIRSRGLPTAICDVVEYFTMDAGGMRWSRHIRQAGHFGYIMLWSAFTAWCVANLTIGFDVVRGLLLYMVCGCLMVTSAVVYAVCQPTNPVNISFIGGSLTLKYGWTFYVCCMYGAFTTVISVLGLLFTYNSPNVSKFLFLVDYDFLDLEQDLEEPIEGVSVYSQHLQLPTPNFKRRVFFDSGSVCKRSECGTEGGYGCSSGSEGSRATRVTKSTRCGGELDSTPETSSTPSPWPDTPPRAATPTGQDTPTSNYAAESAVPSSQLDNPAFVDVLSENLSQANAGVKGDTSTSTTTTSTRRQPKPGVPSCPGYSSFRDTRPCLEPSPSSMTPLD